jgi:N-acyl-D-aspartate/D-glutamate deacylase
MANVTRVVSGCGRTIVTLGLATLLISSSRAQTPQSPQFDIILRGGTVFDGTGAPGFLGDVGIVGSHIASVGDLKERRAAIELDVKGLYVSPGFINIHSHASVAGLGSAENMLTQGVTTEILNADGAGPADLTPLLSRLDAGPLAVNAGACIGFNAIWTDVVGAADRRPTKDDVDRMRAKVLAGLEQGAWCVSAGLDYKPAYFARTDEVIGIVSAARERRTNFTNHDRVTPESGFSSKAGIAETIQIGEASGLMPVITHMKAAGRSQGTASELRAMMDAATQRGAYTAADAYPYVAGQTSLAALIIPGWAQDGGRQEMLKRFADPEVRKKIIAEAEEALTARFGGAAGVYLPDTRQELVDIMRDWRVTAGEAVLRLVEERNRTAILRFGIDADVISILQHPTTSVACDCGATEGNATHPRYFGTYTRVLGRYVRESKSLTWQDAVRKMTGLPASTIGMIDRGLLAAGMAADVTVFDPATVIDHATFDDPVRPSDGITHVIVNGQLAVRDGKITGAKSGRVLQRAPAMPSRPMALGGGRHVTLKSPQGLAVNVRHEAGARQASGTFRVTDSLSKTTIEMVEPGVLQAADRWASFTGRARLTPSGSFAALAVTIDRSAAAPGKATATIYLDGARRLEIAIDSAIADTRLNIVSQSK